MASTTGEHIDELEARRKRRERRQPTPGSDAKPQSWCRRARAVARSPRRRTGRRGRCGGVRKLPMVLSRDRSTMRHPRTRRLMRSTFPRQPESTPRASTNSFGAYRRAPDRGRRRCGRTRPTSPCRNGRSAPPMRFGRDRPARAARTPPRHLGAGAATGVAGPSNGCDRRRSCRRSRPPCGPRRERGTSRRRDPPGCGLVYRPRRCVARGIDCDPEHHRCDGAPARDAEGCGVSSAKARAPCDQASTRSSAPVRRDADADGSGSAERARLRGVTVERLFADAGVHVAARRNQSIVIHGSVLKFTQQSTRGPDERRAARWDRLMRQRLLAKKGTDARPSTASPQEQCRRVHRSVHRPRRHVVCRDQPPSGQRRHPSAA